MLFSYLCLYYAMTLLIPRYFKVDINQYWLIELSSFTILNMPIYTFSATSVVPATSTHQMLPNSLRGINSTSISIWNITA